MINQRAHIHGCLGGTRADIEAVLGYLAQGRVTPHVEHLGFDDVPSGIDRLRAGQVTGRLVVRMD